MAMYVADARHCTISKTETMTLQAGSKVGGQSLNTVPLAVIYDMRGSGEDLCPTLLRGCAGDRLTDYTPGVEDTWRPNDSQPKWIVRRLTPLECIRLQGFPDTWLDGVTLRGKPLADSHKYKLAGNSWAVPCASFIASRIRAWDRLYVGRMLMAAKEVEYAGLVVYGTAEWGVAGFHGDEALLGALFVDDDGYRVIDRDGQTPPGFDAVPLTLGECLALIAAVIVSQAAA
jgi:hypothetical protein